MRKPSFDMQVFKERRAQLGKITPVGSAVIVAAHPEYIRNNDVHHSYRPDSNLFYLTGFEEPEAIFVFRPGMKPESVLFVRTKDPLRETWDGFRYGPEGAERDFQVDKAYLLSDFDKQIVELLKPIDGIYHRWNIDREFDQRVLNLLNDVRLSQGRSGRGNMAVKDSWELIGELRLKKSPFEIETLRKAGAVSAEAQCEAMRFIKPGVSERQILGVVLGTMLLKGAQREGYGTIVASGPNATTLHYVFNDQMCNDGDLLLLDAGAECNYYTGDITRTFPVNGKYTEPQKRVYQGVLDVQKAVIEMIKPGLPFQKLQEFTIDRLTQLMIELKLLAGNKQKLIDSLDFKKYYPHGVSHFLGMDVHDVGTYLVKGESRQLEVGMCFTVEPGLYIPFDDRTAPAELRGIGVRIEDDIIVTETGCEVLTSGVPKEIGETEALMAQEPKYFRA
jgi:Xaa-Pro aminopeptidase